MRSLLPFAVLGFLLLVPVTTAYALPLLALG